MNVKRILLPAVFLAGVVLLWSLAGCSKNSSSTTASDGSLTATVNGTAYSAKSYVVAGYLSAYGQLIVQGDSIRSNDTTEIQVVMPYIPAVNVPAATDSSQDVALTYIKPGGTTYSAYFSLPNSHGTLTLTGEDTVNHRVAGTFSGVLYNIVNSSDSVVITNGAFSSTYTVQ